LFVNIIALNTLIYYNKLTNNFGAAMPRDTAHFQNREPKLESYLRYRRFLCVSKHIKPNSKVLDLGCGFDAYFLNRVADKLHTGIGIDLTESKQANPHITVIAHDVNKELPLEDDFFDAVVSMANMEHLDNRVQTLKEAHRVLAPNGMLLITTPSTKAKPVLEFLSGGLRLISTEEIEDHKFYYDPPMLRNDLIEAGFVDSNIYIQPFQLNFNLFAKSIK
jgi:SAM-dependent methyltransferase